MCETTWSKRKFITPKGIMILRVPMEMTMAKFCDENEAIMVEEENHELWGFPDMTACSTKKQKKALDYYQNILGYTIRYFDTRK